MKYLYLIFFINSILLIYITKKKFQLFETPENLKHNVLIFSGQSEKVKPKICKKSLVHNIYFDGTNISTILN